MFPSKQEFLKQTPEQQSETFARAILEGARHFFVAYLSCVDILRICQGRVLNKTFFGTVTAKTEFLEAYIRQLKLGITVEECQKIIVENLNLPFENFLQALDTAKPRQVLQRDPSAAITIAELNIMLDIQVRRQVLPYLYERNISAESWMALGWTMVVNTELDYGGIAFRNERTQMLVVVYDKDNSVEAEARAFLKSLERQYQDYRFIHTAKDHACLVAANIAKSKDQQVYLFEKELSSLNHVSLTEFDFRMTNIKTDRECNTEDWLKNLRKNIVYLPANFPVNVLCAAVYTRWAAMKVKVFDCLGIQSIDELASFKVGSGGFDWAAYFKSVGYTGKPEKFLLIIRPSERPSPEFYRILLEGAVSLVFLSYQSEGLRTLDVKDLRQYTFYRYSDKTTRQLVEGAGCELILPEEPLKAGEEYPDLPRASVEQQSLECMVMSRVLRQQKVGVSEVKSQFELATLVLVHSELKAESIENLRGIIHESFLKGSYLFHDFSAVDPQELDKLKASGLCEFDSSANSYKFVSNAVYWLLLSQFLLKDFAEFRKNIEIEFKKFSEKDPSCNIFYFNVLPFLYSAVKKPSEEAGIIEKYLRKDNLPAEVKARCYEFFPALYNSLVMIVFFFEYPEYSRYMPYSLIDEYHDHLDALQKPSAGKPSGASAFFIKPEAEVEIDTTDVQCYLNLKVKKEFRGFRPVPKAKIDSYLLNRHQVENDVPYIVAVLPNAETAPARPGELFVRIDRYLDGATQGRPVFIDYLETLAPSFDSLKEYSGDELAGVISSLLPKFSDGEDLLAGLGRTIKEYNTQEDLIKRVEQLKIQNAGFDIFTELNEYTGFFREAAASGIPENCKILFPFNLGNSHWVSVEIKIHKKPDYQYDCSVYLYDPKYLRSGVGDSSAQLGSSNFGLVKSALERRIKACDTKAKVTVINASNPYSNPRQSPDNNVDCGIYAVLDIVTRIAGHSLGEEPLGSPYELRQEMIACMRQGVEDAARADKPLEAVALQKLVGVNEDRLKLYSRSVSGGSLVFKW